MTEDEIFAAIFGGGVLADAGVDASSLERGTFGNLKDLESLLTSRISMAGAGAVDPSLYEDVQTGTETVDLPYRDLYDQFTAYAPMVDPETGEMGSEPLEASIARKVYDQGWSTEQVVAEFRREYALQNSSGHDRVGNNGRHADNGLQAEYEAKIARVRKAADDLGAEKRAYESAKRSLSPEASAYLEANPGARTWSKPIMEQSKAAQAFTDYGLPTPADVWRNDDFFKGFEQRAADTDAKRDFLSQQQAAVRGVRRAAGPRVARRGPGAGQLMQDRNARDAVHASGFNLNDATSDFKDFHKEVTADMNRGRFEGHLADQRRQILAAGGRTPLSEAIRARLGR